MTKPDLKYILLFLAILIPGCNFEKKTAEKMSQTVPIFPLGEKIISNNFTGTVWLEMLVDNDTLYHTSIGNVTFEPGARTNWHKHPGGQVLLVTDGKGFYQEKGKPAQIIKKGDVVKIPPFVEHWHGAAPDNRLTHVAISLNLENGGVEWLLPVTDEEYKSAW